jgi:hypothetical protein
MLAGGAIDLHEVALPEILDPRQVKGLHSGLCSWNVLGALAGFVNGDHVGAVHRRRQTISTRRAHRGPDRAHPREGPT